jgi:hypothetical protein
MHPSKDPSNHSTFDGTTTDPWGKARTGVIIRRFPIIVALTGFVGAWAHAVPKASPKPHLAVSDHPVATLEQDSPRPADIPHGWWIPQGASGQEPAGMKLEEIDGENHLTITLKGGDDYAELFADLGQRLLDGPKRGQVDGAYVYDLAGWKIEAHVRANPDFAGRRSARNGIQFIIKDGHWKNLVQPWQAADGLGTGRVVSFTIPADEPISRQVRALSLKLTLNRNADPYTGTIMVGIVRLIPPGN